MNLLINSLFKWNFSVLTIKRRSSKVGFNLRYVTRQIMRGMVSSSPAQKNPSGLEETHAGMASWYILTREAAHCWRFAYMNTSVLTGRRRLKNSLVILSVASRCRSSAPRLSATSLLQQAFKGTDNWEYNKASSKVSLKGLLLKVPKHEI